MASQTISPKCEVHQFIRKGRRHDKTTGGNVIYMCAAPNCFSTYPRQQLIGKFSICNNCGEQFVLTSEDLKLARPRCMNCSNTKKARSYQHAKNVAKNLFKVNEEEGSGI